MNLLLSKARVVPFKTSSVSAVMMSACRHIAPARSTAFYMNENKKCCEHYLPCSCSL